MFKSHIYLPINKFLLPKPWIEKDFESSSSPYRNTVIVLVSYGCCNKLPQTRSCSVTRSCLSLCDPMDYSTPGFPVLHHLPELAQTHVHWVSDAIQPFHLLLSPSPPAFNLSQHQGLFQWVSSSLRWPKHWSFSFSISSSNEYSGLISFRIDWLDLFAVQGTLKSLLQHHSSKASILQCSAFFMVQLSHSYMTIGKTIALTIWTFISKVMSLLFNMLSRFKRSRDQY